MRPLEAARRGARLVAAKLGGTAVPFHVTLAVNTECNLRCVYCSSPEQRERLLSADQWRRVLDELHALGTERVLFFGGEPLLRKDLGEIVAHARGLGLRCALTSNGALVPRQPGVIRQLDTLVVSLDGDAAAHDRNRGTGSHAAALRGIEAARGWGVPVKVNAVLNANSAGALPWLLEFSRRERIPMERARGASKIWSATDGNGPPRRSRRSPVFARWRRIRSTQPIFSTAGISS